MASSTFRLSSGSLRSSNRLCPTSLKFNAFQVVQRRANSTVPQSAKESLSWPEYLNIRKKKRRWELALTGPCMLLGLVGGAAYFGSLEIDPTKPIFGIDPMFVYGGATVGCVGVGYLMGPVVGSYFWRMTHRKAMNLIEIKDREFHNRIVKNRVDPSVQSPTNPLPDFYGEKIGSLHQYRHWLREQTKYKRKMEFEENH